MSKIDLTKQYTHKEYKAELNKLGIKHISQEKGLHDMYYCGWCKHASLEHGSGEIGGWLLQSCCSKRDMTPVSEFCWCDKFGIDIDSEYWLEYPKESQELFCIIHDRETEKFPNAVKELKCAVVEEIGKILRSKKNDE